MPILLPPCENCCLFCPEIDAINGCKIKKRMKCTARFNGVATPLPDVLWEANGTTNEWHFAVPTIADIIPINGAPGADVPSHVDCIDSADILCEAYGGNPFAFPVHPAAGLGVYADSGLHFVLSPVSIVSFSYPNCDGPYPFKGDFQVIYDMGGMISQGFGWADGEILLEFETYD